jgi:hypothetical protein
MKFNNNKSVNPELVNHANNSKNTEKGKRYSIKNTKDNEGQFLFWEVYKSTVDYIKNNNINTDYGFSFTIPHLIEKLQKTITNWETSIPVDKTPNNYLSNYDLNILNIKNGLGTIYTNSRVIIEWSFKRVLNGEKVKSEDVSTTELLTHPEANCKIIIKSIKGMKLRAGVYVGENMEENTNN